MKTAGPSSVGKNSVASTQDGPSPGRARPRSKTIAAIINAGTSNAADDSDSDGAVSNFTVVKTNSGVTALLQIRLSGSAHKKLAHNLGRIVCLEHSGSQRQHPSRRKLRIIDDLEPKWLRSVVVVVVVLLSCVVVVLSCCVVVVLCCCWCCCCCCMLLLLWLLFVVVIVIAIVTVVVVEWLYYSKRIIIDKKS